MLQRHPADCLSVQDVMVGRFQGGRVTNGQLLLAPAQLGVVLLDRHPLGFERGDDFIDHGGGHVHAGRGEAATVIDRGEELAVFDGQRPFGLEGRNQGEVVLVGGAGDHALEETAPIGGVGLAIQRLHVDEDGARVRRVGGDGEGGRVRHQPDLANRTHAVDAGQVVEHSEGLHGDGQADAGFEPLFQVANPGTLATDDAVVIAIEEAHEAEARGLRLCNDLCAFCVEIDGGCRIRQGGRHRSLDQLPAPAPAVAMARRAVLTPSR